MFLLAIALLGWISPASALDPVAPKSERAYGFLSVESPLHSDVIEASCVASCQAAAPIQFKNDEMVKVPVGDYLVRVKMQDKEWSQRAKVLPTELTALAVTGYGNLAVTAPNPATTMVEVYSADGKQVARFNASQMKTLPTGTYRVTIRLAPELGLNPSEVTKTDVGIVTNETRRLIVWK